MKVDWASRVHKQEVWSPRRYLSGEKPGSAAQKAASSESAAAASPAEATAEPEKMTISLLWKRYGMVAVGTHFSVYFATLAVLTAGVKQGLLGSNDEERAEAIEKVAAKFEPYAPERVVAAIRESPSLGAFAVAWVAAKFTEPFRLVVTIFLVPRIARHLGRAPAVAVAKAAEAAAKKK